MEITDRQILIVEDEPKIADILEDYLRMQGGFSTHKLARGDLVVDWARQHSPDLILLDLMLPGMDGIEVCKRIRAQSSVPIIMITARVEEIDRLLGLELGADDYICKPFSPREVVARVKAVLRRSLPSGGAAPDGLELDRKMFIRWRAIYIFGIRMPVDGYNHPVLLLVMIAPYLVPPKVSYINFWHK